MKPLLAFGCCLNFIGLAGAYAFALDPALDPDIATIGVWAFSGITLGGLAILARS